METLRAVFIKRAKTFTRNGSGLFVKAAQGCLLKPLRAVFLKPLRAVYGNAQGCFFKAAQGCLWKRSGLFLNAQGCFFKAAQGCLWKRSGLFMKTLRAVPSEFWGRLNWVLDRFERGLRGTLQILACGVFSGPVLRR